MTSTLGELIDAARVIAPAEAARINALLDGLALFSPPEQREVTLQYLRDMTPADLMAAIQPLMTLVPQMADVNRG